MRESLAAWQLRVPQMRADWDQLDRSFFQSVSDLASLRMRGAGRTGRMPAAGMPWFMTVFGRDTLITCLQTLLFGPELARTALEVLAELQARDDNPDVDAEPGKIVHELRSGKAAQNWFRTYYGTVDATPLYLVLLSEVWRWTDDASFVRAAEGAGAGGARAGSTSTATATATASSSTSGAPRAGSRTSRGRTPATRSASTTGRSPGPPIAPVEVQGYVYDAKLRTAELAREVWRDRPLAERLEREAEELKRAFNERVLDRCARRLLRARARRREAAGRLALLEHRPPALERDRPAGAGGRGRRRS